MKRPPQRTGITRISENTETRETIQATASDVTSSQSGQFCMGCDKWYPYLRQAKKVCHTCANRLKTLYGIDCED
jgi:predicted amidophosphoribosyltransferase